MKKLRIFGHIIAAIFCFTGGVAWLAEIRDIMDEDDD